KCKVPVNRSQMLDDINELDKIPKHLAVMFWGDVKEEEMVKAAQLCCWAWCYGIKVLSIYEAEGVYLDLFEGKEFGSVQ
ncbi:6358_t:CDS:1, partial [Acaulospora morrowiae]